jgi:hypothetical protein
VSLAAHDDSRPAEARCAEAVVIGIRALLGDDDDRVRAAAVRAGLRPGHLRRVLAGLEPPDLVVIARLEDTFGVRLWPDV